MTEVKALRRLSFKKIKRSKVYVKAALAIKMKEGITSNVYIHSAETEELEILTDL